jgi:hypothetical protein
MLDKGEAMPNQSGRQELLENIVNRYMDRTTVESRTPAAV